MLYWMGWTMMLSGVHYVKRLQFRQCLFLESFTIFDLLGRILGRYFDPSFKFYPRYKRSIFKNKGLFRLMENIRWGKKVKNLENSLISFYKTSKMFTSGNWRMNFHQNCFKIFTFSRVAWDNIFHCFRYIGSVVHFRWMLMK